MIGILGDGPNPSSPEENELAGQPDESRPRDTVWYREAEDLLGTLKGVLSARVVAHPDGSVEEVHILTTDEVAPKQTVRNVESALRARYDVAIDHRKISVAQTTARLPKPKPKHGLKPAHEGVAAGNLPPLDLPPRRARLRAERESEVSETAAPAPAVEPLRPFPMPKAPARAEERKAPAPPMAPAPAASEAPSEERLLFMSHTVESLRSHRLNMTVALEWRGERYVGDAGGADLSRARIEGFAVATLRAIEAALEPSLPPMERAGVALSLDGVQLVEAFDRQFVLVSVNALLGGEITHLTGAAAVEDSKDRAVILATLQATDRRVRAFLQGHGTGLRQRVRRGKRGPDPFDVWA